MKDAMTIGADIAKNMLFFGRSPLPFVVAPLVVLGDWYVSQLAHGGSLPHILRGIYTGGSRRSSHNFGS